VIVRFLSDVQGSFPTLCVPSSTNNVFSCYFGLSFGWEGSSGTSKDGHRYGSLDSLLVWHSLFPGKTIAFLLPAIERLLKAPANIRQGVSILVLSPTRELALQVRPSHHARPDSYPFSSDPKRSRDPPHAPHFLSATCHWGYKVRVPSPHTRASHTHLTFFSQKTELKRLINAPCDILIATPGRLLDHLRSSSLSNGLSELKTIVYDEADRLLDQGFKPALDAISGFLPPRHTRQALLFSATVSKEIKAVC
jgi:ATP-dependent RNA helicase MSS116